MAHSTALVTAEDIYQLVRTAAPEAIGEAAVDTPFDQLDVDSLTLVEIAVLTSQNYGPLVHDWEIAEAGTFADLADLVNQRRVLEEAS
ncbi:acyl carrier protein [Paenarthrobacter sp. NPDC089714]|uniref:acyl carrier protein n=1 Tax=Paenarthrobacter sp. NPDC089714 TaxID=3364377 RepID=UPI00380F29E1